MNELLAKITSGRFLLTIIVGLTFSWLAIHGLMPVDKVNEITLIVLYAYFTKQRTEPK